MCIRAVIFFGNLAAVFFSDNAYLTVSRVHQIWGGGGIRGKLNRIQQHFKRFPFFIVYGDITAVYPFIVLVIAQKIAVKIMPRGVITFRFTKRNAEATIGIGM